jgi:hypothetical protein
VINPFDLEIARGRRDELLREAEERRIARVLRRARRGGGEDRREVPRTLESAEPSWGLADEELTVTGPLYRASRR